MSVTTNVPEQQLFFSGRRLDGGVREGSLKCLEMEMHYPWLASQLEDVESCFEGSVTTQLF